MCQIDDRAIKLLAEKNKLDVNVVELVRKLYNGSIATEVKKATLAHLIKAIETFWQKENKTPCKIDYVPYNSSDPVASVGGFGRGSWAIFRIKYPNSLNDEKLTRELIAHELGHIIIIALKNSGKKEKSLDKSSDEHTERLATTAGEIAIAERCLFYKETARNYIYSCFE